MGPGGGRAGWSGALNGSASQVHSRQLRLGPSWAFPGLTTMTRSSPLHLYLRELARPPGHPRSRGPALQQVQECGAASAPGTQHPTPLGLPARAAVSGSRPAGESTRHPHWRANRNVGEEERNGLGGGHARLGPMSRALHTPTGDSEASTSDSRQDMNFRTTCFRYSKLISRASVRSALFVTEGAMFDISGPGLSRTSKSSLSGLIF